VFLPSIQALQPKLKLPIPLLHLKKILEIGVEGDKIVDFQTGDLSTQEIMEMYPDEPKK